MELEDCHVVIRPDYWDGVEVACEVCNVVLDFAEADDGPLEVMEVAWKTAQHMAIGKDARKAAALMKQEMLIRAQQTWGSR
jgi:uncharacterized protein (DUF983 family)